MYSNLSRGALRSHVNSNARQYSPFNVTSAIRSFHAFTQCQGQPALAESRSYERVPAFETSEELTRSQFPSPQNRFTSMPPLSTSKVLEPQDHEMRTQEEIVPLYYRGSKFDREPYWQKIGRWKDVTEEQFLSHRWNVS